MKYLQESRKYIYVFSAIVGATLLAAPNAFAANFTFTGTGGTHVSATNGSSLTTFLGDVTNTTLIHENLTLFNFVGEGGNDTFEFFGGNGSTTGVATGAGNDTFYVISGSNSSSNIYSLLSGGNYGCFAIADGSNGTNTYAITGGVNSTVQENNDPTALFDCSGATGVGLHNAPDSPIFANPGVGGWGNYRYSINLGDNSSVVLSTLFAGNQTIVNVVF